MSENSPSSAELFRKPKDRLETQMQLLPADDLQAKLSRVRANMEKAGLGSLLLGDNANKLYLTGRIFDGYIYLSPKGETAYFVRRPSVLEGPGVHHIRKPENILEVLEREHIAKPEKLGLELIQGSYATVTRLAKALECDDFGNADTVMLASRAVKTPYELQRIAECGVKHERVYRRIPHLFRDGMTDVELQIEIERITRMEGGLGIIRMVGHDMEINMGSVLAGANADTPSPYDFALGGAGTSPALPVGADGTILREGMSVMVDTNGDFNGYMTDMTRTFAIGQLPQRALDLHQLSRDICRRIEEEARPGVPCNHLYDIAMQMVDKARATDFFMGHRSRAAFIGHGVGIALNGLPVLSAKNKQPLEAGNVIALEPKFVIPEVGAVGIENTYAVTADGPLRCMTNAPEDLIQLGD